MLAWIITLETLARELPWQNALTAVVVIGLLAGMAEWMEAFLRRGSTESQPKPPEMGVGVHALVWVVAILASRGVGRLILQPWRLSSTYGYRLLGLSAGLVCVLDAGLRVLNAGADFGWGHALAGGWPWPAWAQPGAVVIAALVLQVAAAPWLINKKPVPESPERQPLVVWVMLMALAVTTTATQGRWFAATLAGLAGLGIAVAAMFPVLLSRPFVLVKRLRLPVRRTSNEQ